MRTGRFAIRPSPRSLVTAGAVTGVLVALHDSVPAWSAAVVLLGLLAVGLPVAAARATAAIGAAPGAPHVLHLGFEDPQMLGAGGGSLRTHEINRRLAASGWRVTVLTTRFPGAVDRTEMHGAGSVRWVHIGPGRGRTRLGRLVGYVLAAPVIVRAMPADLVVEDFIAPISSMAVPWWSGRPTVGVVQWLNAREHHVPVHLVERLAVRSHRRLVAVSHGVAAQLATLAPHARIDVIGNGVDPLALSVGRVVRGDDVVFVGRLETAQKGLDLLLDAWAQAAPQLPGRLVIAGTGPDEEELRARAAPLGDRVRFVGWVAGREKFALMATARVVVVPSRFETFGIVAAEALATGTAVLAYDIDCLREVVPPGCGGLVPYRSDHATDVAAFAAELVDLHRDQNRIAAAAWRGPLATPDWDALARAQEAVYRAAVPLITSTCEEPT